MNRSVELVTRVRKARGQRPLERAARAMIVGIPNVGKSSLINRMAQKNCPDRDQPAVTKREQWVRLSPKLHLLDTPECSGISSKIKRSERHLPHVAASRKQFSTLLKSLHLLSKFDDRYPEAINKRFKLQDMDRTEIVERIGRKRDASFLAVVDLTKAAGIICREFRGGQLGRVSMEAPDRLIQTPSEPLLDNDESHPLTSSREADDSQP